MLKALIFDVDGTLADTEEAHRQAFNQAFSEANLDWNWDMGLYKVLLAVTGGKERIRHYIGQYEPEFESPGDLASWIARLHARKTEIYAQMAQSLVFRPGILRLLKQAKQAGIRLAIATTTTRENVDALLSQNLTPVQQRWFEAIGAGNVIAAKKPASDIYDHVLDQLKLAPGECLAIEDSANGVSSATGAGIKTVVTVNDYTTDDNFDGALLVMDQLGEPDKPFKILSGETKGNENYFNIELAKRLLQDQ